ncbi:hypothetical protein EJ02DRAFT_459120 [Clathrospora elynae]|uniref:Uncharacterized protein n=1 Tax=Clathrospora elynae TaxID=706981 RepID=A0A6A5SBM0_9PLEO|nr:hypothetical protein EJ02DRAFT_459120 [Clathrospora elynae]
MITRSLLSLAAHSTAGFDTLFLPSSSSRNEVIYSIAARTLFPVSPKVCVPPLLIVHLPLDADAIEALTLPFLAF